jgi:hypothetical protein
MKTIQAYQTDDGQIFTSLTEARVHEECEKLMPEINAFMNSADCKYNNCAHAKIVKNTLLAFHFWKADGGINQ